MKSATDQARTLREMAADARHLAVARDRRRVIAVTGGKGGVGKSTLALNLAVTYGMRGSPTVALDGDLAMADLNLLLGLAPSKSMLDVLSGTSIDEVLVQAHGIHLLPGLNGSYKLADLGDDKRETMLDQVAELTARFETVVVDTAAGIGKQTMALASAATDIIVVATPEALSMADAYACLKVLATQHRVKRALLVPNTVASEVQADDVFAQLSALVDRFLGLELLRLPALPYDPAISHAAMDGVPLVLARPDAIASRAIQRIARAIDTLATDRGVE